MLRCVFVCLVHKVSKATIAFIFRVKPSKKSKLLDTEDGGVITFLKHRELETQRHGVVPQKNLQSNRRDNLKNPARVSNMFGIYCNYFLYVVTIQKSCCTSVVMLTKYM
jgi:hypothetical protein